MTEAWAIVEEGTVIGACEADRIVPWWSFTKTVLAAAALVLVRDGLMALDEPLEDRPYTLRNLLQHRAGLTNYGGFAAYHEAVARGDDPWPVPVLLDRVEASRLRYRPSEGWEYSNIGYLYVRQLIEKAAGEDLNAALQRLVLKPLGAERAQIARERADLENVAMGDARNYHPGWVYHGLLIGPVTDAARLLDGFMAGHLLPPHQLRDMLTPHVLPGPIPGRPWAVPGYGLGLMTGETTARQSVAGHTGGGPGSTIAVYNRTTASRSGRTAAFFRTDEDQAGTEKRAFHLLND